MIILDTSPQTIIVIGRSGENIVTTVEFDITEYVNAFGNGYAYLWFVRPSDKYEYPIQLTATENNIVQWSVSSADTLYKGTGKVQLMYTVNNEIKKKSKIFTVKVGESLTPTDAEPPEPYQTWLDQVVQASAEATAGAETASAKANEASASATSASESALSASQNAEQTQADVNTTNANVTTTEQYMRRAETALNGAQEAQRGAETSAGVASDKAEIATRMADSASQSASNADLSAQDAEMAKNTAVTKADEAEQSAIDADTSADDAQGYANDAQTARTGAETARNEAVTAKNDATTAKNEAVTAKNEAVTAKNGAETAQGKAEEAQGKAEEAQDNAESFAESAQASADRAEQEADRWYEFLPVDSASGSLAHITDGAKDVPVKSLSVALEPIQDLHGQDAPYPAGGGGNLVDFDEVVTALVDTPLVQLTAGTYYLYVANEKTMAFNSYAQYSTDGTTFANISTSSEGVDVYTNQVMNYNTKKCILTVVNPVYVRVRIQTNANLSGATVKVLLTKDSTNYSVIPNAVYSTNADFQAIYKPFSNICPITGHTQVVVNRTGKNLLKLDESEMISSGFSRAFPNPIPCAGQYKLTCQNRFGASENYMGCAVVFRNEVGGSGIGGYYAGNAFGNTEFTGITTTITEEMANAKYIVFLFRASGATFSVLDNAQIQIEPGTAASSYEPYSGQSITIPLGDTVYGGTLDVTNGVLTVDRFMYEPTTPLVSVSSQTDTVAVFFIAFANNNLPQSVNQRIISNRFSITIPANTAGRMVLTGQILYIVIAKSELASVDRAGLLAWLEEHPSQFCYELANPITIEMTPQQMTTLLGINNVWSDSGDVSVDYRADVQLYIQKMIANALNA